MGGQYVFGELLGRGGMAEVFSGFALGSHGFQKPVALKRLLPELANNRGFVARLIAEAKLLVGLAHGNVVSVLDLVRDGDDVFLVMEYVDGPSLRQMLAMRGDRRIPHGVAAYIIESAAAGLACAHAQPGGAVIHADVSPSNILMTSTGAVRVADFGIARREGVGCDFVEGKFGYMAPEHARGEALTPGCDVYSLGVVMYELLTGRHPLAFNKVNAEDKTARRPPVVPPRVVDAGVPVGLEAICMMALAEDPRNRFATMQELIEALVEERFANGWKEGANELSHVIGGLDLLPTLEDDGAAPRPSPVMTRSLLRDPAPPRFAHGTQPPASTSSSPANVIVQGEVEAAPMLVAPRGSVVDMIAHGALRSSTVTASVAPSLPQRWRGEFAGLWRSRRRPLLVLLVASVVGTLAALAVQLAPVDSVEHAHAMQAPTAEPTVTPIDDPGAANSAPVLANSRGR